MILTSIMSNPFLRLPSPPSPEICLCLSSSLSELSRSVLGVDDASIFIHTKKNILSEKPFSLPQIFWSDVEIRHRMHIHTPEHRTQPHPLPSLLSTQSLTPTRAHSLLHIAICPPRQKSPHTQTQGLVSIHSNLPEQKARHPHTVYAHSYTHHKHLHYNIHPPTHTRTQTHTQRHYHRPSSLTLPRDTEKGDTKHPLFSSLF